MLVFGNFTDYFGMTVELAGTTALSKKRIW